MRSIGEIIRNARKEKHMSQAVLAQHLAALGYDLTNKAVSRWEKDQSEPSVSVFIEVCRFLGVRDIYEAYFGTNENSPISELNETGQSKVLEYAALLAKSGDYQREFSTAAADRDLRLYDEAVSAGRGNFLTGDNYEMITVGNEVPANADFGVRIAGDSMMPRYIDGQIVFVHHQISLENGEIGIFSLNGEAYIKKLQNDANGRFLISLNKKYPPIHIPDGSEFTIFGKVVG